MELGEGSLQQKSPRGYKKGRNCHVENNTNYMKYVMMTFRSEGCGPRGDGEGVVTWTTRGQTKRFIIR